MMRLHGIYHDRRFLELPAYLGAKLNMASFHVVIDRLTDIVQKSCSLGKPYIDAADLRSKETGKLSYFDGMLQGILPVTRPEFHLSEKLHKLRVNAVDPDFQKGFLAFFLLVCLCLTIASCAQFVHDCRKYGIGQVFDRCMEGGNPVG